MVAEALWWCIAICVPENPVQSARAISNGICIAAAVPHIQRLTF